MSFARRLVGFGPHAGAHQVAARAAISVLVPLLVLEASGHLTWSIYASFGAFTSLYGRERTALPRLRLQVAVPKYPWTDLAYSLAPNGHGADPYSSAQGEPATLGVGNPFGVAKTSYIGGLYALGTTNGVFDEGSPTPQTNGPEPFTAWLGRVNAGEPYSAPGRVDDPLIGQMRTSFSGWHSAYYQPGWRLGKAAGRMPAVFVGLSSTALASSTPAQP